MFNVRFSRDRALAVVGHLERGEPIPSPAGGWTPEDAMTVIGVLLEAVQSHGPPALRGVDPATLPKEHLEAHMQALGDDVLVGARYCALMAMLARKGGYDPLFEPVQVVQVDGRKPEVLPVSGVKEALFEMKK